MKSKVFRLNGEKIDYYVEYREEVKFSVIWNEDGEFVVWELLS